MTYTFKLARRLAVSRDFGVLTALALVAACTGDSTAPNADTASALQSPAILQLSPRSVTVETNQRVRFSGHARSSRGDSVATPVVWLATGGVINADGTFTSAASGTFKIIGRGRGWKQVDTSVVVVVPPANDLARIAVRPRAATLVAGGSRAFTATAVLKDSSRTAMGVTWTATGGTVDAAGLYAAGTDAGEFHVVATNTTGTVADTALITIEAAGAPAPTPTPPPPAPTPTPTPPPPAPTPTPTPTPTLARVIVSPVNVALGSGGTRQFNAYGRDTAGDSVAVSVTFQATGGSVTPAGLYTAGPTGGSFRVVASTSGLADTAFVSVSAPPAPPPPAPSPALGTGIPFGSFGQWEGASLKPGSESLTLSQNSNTASTVVSQIAAARANRSKLMLALTGGAHENYLTNGTFDRSKWNARMNSYNTQAIREAIAAGVADGTIVGNVVMDEPNVSGGGADGNTWGPSGTMTKARVDSLCGYVKAMFPTLPAGVQHKHDVFEPSKSYRVCDFLNSQYSARFGSPTQFRDGALAMGRRDGHAILFGLNILNGGEEDRDGTWDCATEGGALGKVPGKCRMTAAQVREWGLTFGPAGCALLMWRYDDQFMSNPDNRLAFKDVAARLSTLQRKACIRS